VLSFIASASSAGPSSKSWEAVVEMTTAGFGKEVLGSFGVPRRGNTRATWRVVHSNGSAVTSGRCQRQKSFRTCPRARNDATRNQSMLAAMSTTVPIPPLRRSGIGQAVMCDSVSSGSNHNFHDMEEKEEPNSGICPHSRCASAMRQIQ